MNPKNFFYLDNAATTFLDPRVASAMSEVFLGQLGNPASQHHLGRAARILVESAKDRILQYVDAPRDGVDSALALITSGGTEANNLAIRGLSWSKPGAIVVSSIEHPSVLECALQIQSTDRQVRLLPVDKNGLCQLDILRDWLKNPSSVGSRRPPISLVSIILANNEVGVVQDLRSICSLCHEYGVLVHADAVQAVGKIEFSMRDTGLDALTITAHKLHGPVGIGALILRAGLLPSPLFFGGGQQLAARPGTEPVGLLVGFAKALELAIEAVQNGEYLQLAGLRSLFEEGICSQFADSVVFCKDAPRLPHISNLGFCNLDRQALQMALDLSGVLCSAGSACSSGSSRPSPILQAMAVPDCWANGALRFSFSRYSSREQVLAPVPIIIEILRKMSPRAQLRT